mmetsp:Transcript_71896/g.181399  ORF Transcript_71896/g.181399 Transcript_71896/m.181399 type:complete len:223 (-) Transcript_71896:1068-1736(-)
MRWTWLSTPLSCAESRESPKSNTTTRATPGMSRPRAATSVAIRTPFCLFFGLVVMALNVLRTSSRSHCSLSPWMALAHPQMIGSVLLGFHESLSSRKSQVFLRMAKTTAVSPCFKVLLSTCCNFSTLLRSGSTKTCCVTFGLAVRRSPAPCPMRICTAFGLVREAAARCTALGHVAVKKSVCLAVPASASSGYPEALHAAAILRMSGSKPMSSILSASSSTK